MWGTTSVSGRLGLSAEEIAAYLSGPGEEIRPGDLTVRDVRRQTVSSRMQAWRRRAVQPAPKSSRSAGLVPAAWADVPAQWPSHRAYITGPNNMVVPENTGSLTHTCPRLLSSRWRSLCQGRPPSLSLLGLD